MRIGCLSFFVFQNSRNSFLVPGAVYKRIKPVRTESLSNLIYPFCAKDAVQKKRSTAINAILFIPPVLAV
jgi:hypothetical protein